MLRLLTVTFTLAVIAGPVMAANARNPYGNIDRRVDEGNDTGNSQVDQLNAAQLDQNYYRNHGGAPMNGAMPMPPPAGYPARGPQPQ